MRKKTLLVSLLSLAMLTACSFGTTTKSEPAKESEATTSAKEESNPASEKESAGGSTATSTPAASSSAPAKSSTPAASSSTQAPAPDHNHAFANEGAKVNDAQPIKCSCGYKGYDLLAAGKTVASGKWDNGKLKGDIEWSVTGIEAGTYQVYIKGTYSSGNGSKGFTGDSVSTGYTSRYTFQADSADEVNISNETSYSGLGWSQNGSGDAAFTNASLCEVAVAADTAKLAIRYHADGYSAYIDTIRLVKAGSSSGGTTGGATGGDSTAATSTPIVAPTETSSFSNVTLYTTPINNKTADQKAFIEYTGDYTALSASNFQSQFHTSNNDHQSDPNAVPFSFNHTVPSGKTLSKYVLEFATDSAFTKDVLSYEGTSKSFSVYNLYIGTHYYYRVKAVYTAGDPEISATYELNTADAGIRNLRVEGMTNIRDLGGKTTEGGRRIKQGLLYRTGAPNDSQSQSAITAAGKTTMLKEMGVKTEIELREMGFNCPTTSPIGSSVKIIHNAMEYQGGKNLIFRNIAPMLRCFDILGDANNYPVFFHCRIGTDRTGFMALLINGVLGLPMRQIYQDYLFSNFGRIGKTSTCDQENDDSTKGYIAQINTYPGSTFQEKCYNFLVTAGVPHEKLDTMINLLTEGASSVSTLANIGVLKAADFTLSGATMTTATTTISKSTVRNPGYNYFKLGSTSATATYNFTVNKAFTGNLYGTFMAKNTSLNINSAMTITLDGNALALDSTSFATTTIGFDNNTEYWTTWKLGSINVAAAGSHTLVIKPKTSTAISYANIAMYSTNGAITVAKA